MCRENVGNLMGDILLSDWEEVNGIIICRDMENVKMMKIICKDIGCLMLTLVYLENLMGDIQYKMWFSIRVREGIPHPQCFSLHLPFSFLSGVELKFCLLSENVKILLKW